MQEVNIYEYAVLRLVPRVEREEFINVGLILFSKRADYIRTKIHLCPEKMAAFGGDLNWEEVLESLNNICNVSKGEKGSSPIAELSVPERFRWLTAVRSAIIQTSRPHPGKTKDLDATFDRLFTELIL